MRHIIQTVLAVLALGFSAPAIAQEAPEPSFEFAFEEVVTLGPAVQVDDTAYGGRNIIPITGGRFEGPGIRGEVMPGGWDWQLRRADGCTELEAVYFLRTDDGVVIHVLNRGVGWCPGAEREPLRTVPVFEAPIGKYDWLTKSAFIGTLLPAAPEDGPAVRLRFHRVR